MRIIFGIIIGCVIGFGVGRLDPETFDKGKDVVSEVSETVVDTVKEAVE